MAARGRAAPVQPGDGVPAPARHPQPAVRRVPRSTPPRWTSWPAEAGSLRGLFALRSRRATPIPLDEVEPVSEIVKRFATGAMSYGSISAEAHETLAIAMNRLGGRSNTGEGGEDVDRLYDPAPPLGGQAGRQRPVRRHHRVPGQRRRPADQDGAGRQARRGRPAARQQGVAVDRQDPARHPGRRPDLAAAAPRHLLHRGPGPAGPRPQDASTRPRGCTSSWSPRSGVGTVAAGVAKLKADVILISGHDGGTGASPLNSLKHAGTPWELGLAETQQTLLLNGLRDRVTVQVDGQLKTGRDVVIAALLGAEEFGFATAPLIVAGCVMMRVCHLDTCPVGIATQNPVLRERFTGKPEFVENFFLFLAEEVRELPGRAGLPHPRRGDRPRRAARHRAGGRPLEGARPRPVARAARAGAARRAPRGAGSATRTTAWTRRWTTS